jgi:hypothetical protein
MTSYLVSAVEVSGPFIQVVLACTDAFALPFNFLALCLYVRRPPGKEVHREGCFRKTLDVRSLSHDPKF